METIDQKQLEDLQSKGKKILVQYTAAWCGPCRALTPKLANMSNSFSDVDFVKIDVEENPEITQELMISSVPTVTVYKGKEIVDRSRGVQPDHYYKEILNNL